MNAENTGTAKTTFDHGTGRLIPSGDAEIYVEEAGNPGGRALLLLHGGFGSLEDFNGIAPALGARFRLVGVDSRGHGRSSLGAGRLSYRLLAEDIGRIVEALGLGEYDILGFSDGGIAAYRRAMQGDPKLGKLVTVGANWEMRESDGSWKMIRGMTGKKWKRYYPASYESYMRRNPKPDFDAFSARVIAMWTDLGPDGYPGARMRRIRNEILVVRGDSDPLTSLESMAGLREVAGKASFLNIPFAGHAAFDDAREVFLLCVQAFLGAGVP